MGSWGNISMLLFSRNRNVLECFKGSKEKTLDRLEKPWACHHHNNNGSDNVTSKMVTMTDFLKVPTSFLTLTDTNLFGDGVS